MRSHVQKSVSCKAARNSVFGTILRSCTVCRTANGYVRSMWGKRITKQKGILADGGHGCGNGNIRNRRTIFKGFRADRV